MRPVLDLGTMLQQTFGGRLRPRVSFPVFVRAGIGGRADAALPARAARQRLEELYKEKGEL